MSFTGRKLALGSALRVISLVATALVSLVMMPFIVRSLGDHMYGIWALVAAVVGYYGLLDLGLSSAVSRYLAAALGAGDQDQCNSVFSTSVQILTACGFVVLVLGCISAAVSSLFRKAPEDAAIFWKLILLVSITLATSFPIKVFRGVLEAHLRFDCTTSIEILGLGLRTGLIVVVLLMGLKVVALAWTTLLASIPIDLAYVYYAYKYLPFLRIEWKHWHWQTARELFSYSFFTLIAILADVLRFQVDAVVVAFFVGVAALTHYRIAGALTEYYIGLVTAVIGVFSTVFGRQQGSKDFDSLRNTFLFASKISVCVSTFVGFGLLAWGKPFITRWMGPQYQDAYPCMMALVSGCIVALWQIPSIALLYAISKHRYFALFNSIEGILNLVLSILLAKRYGILGVALGTMIPMMLTKLFIQPIYVCRVASINYVEYLQKMGRTVAAAVASLVIPIALTITLARPDYKVLIFTGVLSLVAYGIPLWFLAFSSFETRLIEQTFLSFASSRRGT